jgi:superfamily I DNA/RNA helicase
MKLTESLNTEQRAAVEADDGPVVIIAGPGTGKTKTLTARIAHLILTGKAAPGEVLALTFTNKAAREMKERLTALLPKRDLPMVSTFHGLAQRMLDDFGMQLIAEPERTELLRTIKRQTGAKQSVRDLSLLISKAKNQLQPPEDATLRTLVDEYNLALAERGLYDFDDLLLRLHGQLQQTPDHPYRYILVDEFQDTNDLQFELLRLLNTADNVFVIGDPLQSIYGFRGASAAIFERFMREWPAAATVTLITNYRSTAPIVQAAAAVFPEAPKLQAHRTDAGKICLLEVLNEYSEADWIVNEIERQVGGSTMLASSQHHTADQQRTFSDFAVLYRTHAAAKTVQRALEASGIPYQVAGEGSPYEQAHIQTLLSALRYIAGDAPVPTVSGATSSQIEALLTPLKDQPLPLAELVPRIAETLGLATEKHAASVRQFMNGLLPFAGKPIQEYLKYVQAIAEQEYYDPSAAAVTLLTIHAAKGLEFSRVFLIATEEGTLPHLPKGRPADIDEERRLFFVAVTRARDELYLLHARKRTGEPRELSRFASSLPSFVERITDPTLADQQRKIFKRQQKRSQTSLF